LHLLVNAIPDSATMLGLTGAAVLVLPGLALPSCVGRNLKPISA
jgi:hypothetical protein